MRGVQTILMCVALLPAAAMVAGCSQAEETSGMTETKPTPGPAGPAASGEKATFAAGCFWGVEAAFRRQPGVIDTAVGYSGGHTVGPTYKDICTDRTGHAEVVQVIFDPSKTSYETLLEVFWACHDPTTPNRQGPDVGSQYRSAVFCHTDEQEASAKAVKAKLTESGKFPRPIVTEITAAGTFYRAEDYHQRYVEKHGGDACPVPP